MRWKMKNKNTILRAILVFAFSLGAIFFIKNKIGADDAFDVIKKIGPIFIAACVLTMFMFFLLEAISYKYLLSIQGYEVSFKRCFGYTFTDYFFSMISPGGSLGQPLQYHTMRTDNIDSLTTINSLLSFNWIYHLSMVIIFFVAMIFGLVGKIAAISEFKYLVIYGIVCQLVLVIGIGFLMFDSELAARVIRFFNTVFSKFKLLKRFSKSEEDITKTIEEHKNFGKFLINNKKVFAKLLCISIPMLLFSFAIPAILYKSFGLNSYNFMTLVLIQAVVTISFESVHIPGGVGVIEGSMMLVYSSFMPKSLAFSIMAINRFVTFYLAVPFAGLYFLLVKTNRKNYQKNNSLIKLNQEQ